MAEFFEALTDAHREMIARQPVFFTATAAAEGRINLSPKGYDALRILSPTRIATLDLAGSGNETQAHLAVDGRITIMVCNWQQPALILRVYGTARAVMPGDAEWEGLAAHFTLLPGTRQIFDVAVDSVQTSCGWGVPLMALEAERPTLLKAHAQTPEDKWLAKQGARDRSIDGLPVVPPTTYITG